MALFTKVAITTGLVTDMVDWKQKPKNQWVQIEISHVKLGNFF